MGFGALIASGESNELLSERLMECVIEARVEQFLDEPSHFAIRFQEDLSEGEPHIMRVPELQPEEIITIAVQDNDTIWCLVRGPVTDVKCSMVLGGTGSWFEIRGRDRRVEMDRQCFRHAWEGLASEAAQTILAAYGFEPIVQETTRVYAESTGTLNQRATDLEFLSEIARVNNLCLWVAYRCQLHGLDPTRGRLEVMETANLASSPPRANGTGDSSSSPEQVKLIPTVGVRLKVNVDPDECQNVAAFDLDLDVERPEGFSGTALNDRDLTEDSTTAADPQPPLRDRGLALSDLTGKKRTVCITTAGDVEELRPRAESMLTEAGWFVHATASTSAHMLGGVLQPHDVVEVDGLGPKHSGAYQIKAVTHVINPADHFMDLELRRNAVGQST